ncbi:MAG: type 1 glutamine amidotransferase [Rhodospirillales bacterium]|nr:MAG: type 1 glutamine amidotransferase [Rhodospirillales bacterium]
MVATVFLAAASGSHAARAESGEATDLSGKHVAILVGEGFQDAETFMPMAYLLNRGATATVIGVEPGIVTAYNSQMTAIVEKSVTDVQVDDFDALVIPGGQAPDRLRQHEQVVTFAKEFFESGKPTAAICHGPQVLIEAGVLEGRDVTCYAGVADEVTAAGGRYLDMPVVRDGNLITSRIPDDIPEFSAAIAEALME